MMRCAICELNLRYGDSPRPIRLAAEDVTPVSPPPFAGKEAGLYHACGECLEKFRPLAAARLGVPVEGLPNDMLC